MACSISKLGRIVLKHVGSRNYHHRIVNHFENPRNVGSFSNSELNVYTALVGAPACGDVMKLQIKIDKGVIVDSKFKTFGCGSAIAASSYTTEWVKNKTVTEAWDLSNLTISAHLNLPPVKLHCSMLAEDALKMALEKYNFIMKKPTERHLQRGP